MNIMDVAGNIPNAFSNIPSAFGLSATRSTSFEISRTLGIATAGLLIGAGLALLLAPKAGADLRRDIEKGFAELRKQLRPTSDVVPSNLT